MYIKINDRLFDLLGYDTFSYTYNYCSIKSVPELYSGWYSESGRILALNMIGQLTDDRDAVRGGGHHLCWQEHEHGQW